MNAELLKQAGIDYDRGVRRFMGRAPLYEKSLGKFMKDDTFLRTRAAYQAGDDAQLLAHAHELKGVCGNIGLTALYEAADALVELLRGPAHTREEVSAAYQQLADRYQVVDHALLAAMEDTP